MKENTIIGKITIDLDGKPIKLLFLIAAPNSKDNLHLEVLSRLSALLMDEKFRKKFVCRVGRVFKNLKKICVG